MISKLDWKIYVHAFNIDLSKNNNKLMQKMLCYDEQTKIKLSNFKQRLDTICIAAMETQV